MSVNVVTGAGPTAGAALVAHPKVRMISMTGSSETGKRVMRDSAATLKRLTLELGGKNAQIVLPDADLDRAAQGIMLGAFLNQGQVCTAGFAHLRAQKYQCGAQGEGDRAYPEAQHGRPVR